MLISATPLLIFQDDDERDYAVDTFWLENIHFKQKIDTLAFSNLFEVRETANSLYSLALEFNLGDKVKNEFIDKIKFINYLLENLGHGGHGIALQRLKDKFGGKKGMSSKSKKEADRIIRESLRGNSMQAVPPTQQFQGFGPMPHMAMPQMTMPFPGPQFGQPQFPFPPQQQPNMGRGVNGPCFVCQQYGHVARFCPNSQPNQSSYRGGGNFRRGGGRGNSGKRYQNKKRN